MLDEHVTPLADLITITAAGGKKVNWKISGYSSDVNNSSMSILQWLVDKLQIDPRGIFDP